MTSKTFREALERRAANAGVTVSSDVATRLETYFDLLARWNTKINLTSVPTGDPTDETYDRLFVEPLAAAKYLDSSGPWLDIGSGGGSPALPLKIVRPELPLTMVESKSRKAAFLREAVRELGLDKATVDTSRAEDLAVKPNMTGSVGLITVRGVRIDASLIQAFARLLRHRGRLLLFQSTPARVELSKPTLPFSDREISQDGGFAKEASAQLISGTDRPSYLVCYGRSSVPRGTSET